MQGNNRDTDVENRLGDSVEEELGRITQNCKATILKVMTVLHLLFPLGFLSFLFLPSSMARTFKRITLNKKIGKCGYLVLFLFWRKCLHFFTIENVCCEFVIYVHRWVWEYVPSMTTFWTVFIINGRWVLSSFSASIKMIMFLFFYVYNASVANLPYEKPYFLNKSQFIRVYDPINILQYLVS